MHRHRHIAFLDSFPFSHHSSQGEDEDKAATPHDRYSQLPPLPHTRRSSINHSPTIPSRRSDTIEGPSVPFPVVHRNQPIAMRGFGGDDPENAVHRSRPGYGQNSSTSFYHQRHRHRRRREPHPRTNGSEEEEVSDIDYQRRVPEGAGEAVRIERGMNPHQLYHIRRQRQLQAAERDQILRERQQGDFQSPPQLRPGPNFHFIPTPQAQHEEPVFIRIPNHQPFSHSNAPVSLHIERNAAPVSHTATFANRQQVHPGQHSLSRAAEHSRGGDHEMEDQPTPPGQQAPASEPHRVWLVRCKACDIFITDRGMRAVLLLVPHVELFSTDAEPCNSGPYYFHPDGGPTIERTCNCLTQTLACHGCGSIIGYHIVNPCQQCKSACTQNMRNANHHRFVFHASEITASERRYVPDEPGVHNPLVHPSLSRGHSDTASSEGSETAVGEEDQGGDQFKDSAMGRDHDHWATSRRSSEPLPPGHYNGRYYREEFREQYSAHSLVSRQRLLKPRYLLQEGDVVYWHQLFSWGERMEPVDPKTRSRPAFKERVGR